MRESLLKPSAKAIGGILAEAGIAVCIAWLLLASREKDPVVREYQAQGFQMVHGCNGGAANWARAEVYRLQERLEDFGDSPDVDTNVIDQLKSALVIAQEKHRILSDDCARRGHCETYPWKSSWAMIEEVLTTSEKLYH